MDHFPVGSKQILGHLQKFLNYQKVLSEMDDILGNDLQVRSLSELLMWQVMGTDALSIYFTMQMYL